jgi:AcrR family transcriptional regulator
LRADAPDGVQKSRSRRGADRRREILAAARKAFSEKGFEATSMAEIARAVGVVEGAIYKHFDSKRDLLFEAIREFYAPMIAETREQLAGVVGTRNRLRFAIWRQLRSYAAEPDACRLIIEEIRPRSDYHQSVVRDLNRELTSVVRSIIQEGIDRGELRPDVSPATVRDVIYGGSEHLAWKALTGRESLDVDRLTDELTDLIWRGVERRAGDAGERREPKTDDDNEDHHDSRNDGRRSRRDDDRSTTEKLEAQVARLEAAIDALLAEKQ